MPLRHEPPTLQKATMLTIARNFDNICYGAKTREDMCRMIHDESYLSVEGPFKNMPSSVLEGLLLSILRDERCHKLNRTHYHALIQPHLQTFKLATHDGESLAGLKAIMARCQRLKRLDLSYLRTVGPPALIRLVPTLTHLTYLNLTMTQTVDQILGLVGEYCPELKELNVSHTPITDQGLYRLCYNSDLSMAQCQNLGRVCMAECGVSPGAVAFLLQYLPKLTHLDYDHIFHVFGVLEEWGATPANAPNCEKYQLRVLTSASEKVDPYTVDLAVTLCPLVMELTVSNAWVDNSVLYPAMRLENLAHLRLTNSEGLSLDFHEGVLPILTIRGHALISLLLANFTTVDIAAIGDCCPRLQNLALSAVDLYEDIMYPRENYFNCLVNLEVWTGVTVDTCNSIIFRQLLTYCPNLQNLLVKGADALSDKLFVDIWRSNEMRYLSRLTLDTCHNVTSATLHQLLDSHNNLTLMRIWGCFFINKHDSEELHKRISEENCDIYLEWYCWDG